MPHPHLAACHPRARTMLSLDEYLSVPMAVWVSVFTSHCGDRRQTAQHTQTHQSYATDDKALYHPECIP